MTVGTRLSAAGRHVKACHLSAQSTIEGRGLGNLKDVGFYFRHTTGQLCPLLCAVTHHDDLVKVMRVLVQTDTYYCVALANLHTQTFIANVADIDV